MPATPKRSVNQAMLGFGVFLALGSTSAWGLITLVNISATLEACVTTFETCRSAGFIATLVMFGLGCLYLNPLFNRSLTLASTVLWIAGYAGLFGFAFASEASPLLVQGSAFFIGVAHALSLMMWQRFMASLEGARANRTIVVGTALGGVLYLGLSFVEQPVAYAVAVLGLIGLNAWFLHGCTRGLFEARRLEPSCLVVAPSASAELQGLALSAWRPVLCVATVGYVSGVTRIMARSTQADALLLNVFLAVGMLVAAVLLLWVWERLHWSFTFNGAYTVIFFGIITGFLVLPFLGGAYRTVFAGISNLAFTLVSMFMMITCLRIARVRSLDPIAVFGLFAGSVYLCVLVGRVVGACFGNIYDFSQVLVLALLSVYILSFAGALVGMFKGTGDAIAFDPIRGDGSEDGPSLQETDTPKPPTEPHAEPSPAQPHVMTRQVVVVQDMVPVYCAALKKTYRLSNRETDVLELIVRGRDVAHMAETLYVSENTVRSHCKTLYKKLDVHNRQQVLDLLETQRAYIERDNEDKP